MSKKKPLWKRYISEDGSFGMGLLIQSEFDLELKSIHMLRDMAKLRVSELLGHICVSDEIDPMSSSGLSSYSHQLGCEAGEINFHLHVRMPAGNAYTKAGKELYFQFAEAFNAFYLLKEINLVQRDKWINLSQWAHNVKDNSTRSLEEVLVLLRAVIEKSGAYLTHHKVEDIDHLVAGPWREVKGSMKQGPGQYDWIDREPVLDLPTH